MTILFVMLSGTDQYCFLSYTSYIKRSISRKIPESKENNACANVRQNFLLLLLSLQCQCCQTCIEFNSLMRLPERQKVCSKNSCLTQVQIFSDQKVSKALLVYFPELEVALGFGSRSTVMHEQWCFLCSQPSLDKWKSLPFGKLRHFLDYDLSYVWIWVVCEYIWKWNFCPFFQKTWGFVSVLCDMLNGIYLKSSFENWINLAFVIPVLRMRKETFSLFSLLWIPYGSKSFNIQAVYLTHWCLSPSYLSPLCNLCHFFPS